MIISGNRWKKSDSFRMKKSDSIFNQPREIQIGLRNEEDFE